MTPDERANIILSKCKSIGKFGDPMCALPHFVLQQVNEAIDNDWPDRMRKRSVFADQRALVDALIVAMEAATDISLDHQQRIDRVRQALTPHVKAKT